MNLTHSITTSFPLGLLVACSSLQAATTLYHDDFSGTSADLDSTTPDIGAVNWMASSNFNADGSTEDGPGSATLAFTPVDGTLYILDVSYSGLGLVGGADSDWFALGFANGQSIDSNTNNRFITGNVIGSAWMLVRGDQTLNPNAVAWNGTGSGANGGTNGGSFSTQLTPITSEIDMRIVLDTRAGLGPNSWTATWSVKRAADSSYTVVRATENLQAGAGATINSVGIARSNPGVTGTVESFSLTVIPEPSTTALLGLGGLALILRRRK